MPNDITTMRRNEYTPEQGQRTYIVVPVPFDIGQARMYSAPNPQAAVEIYLQQVNEAYRDPDSGRALGLDPLEDDEPEVVVFTYAQGHRFSVEHDDETGWH